MIEIKGNVIEEPVLDILYDLRRDLMRKGIDKLQDIIVKGVDAVVTCIHHKNGKEAHPSCFVKLTDGDGVEAGTVHCFTCGYRSYLPRFISECYDVDDDGSFGEDWLLQHCKYSYLTERRSIQKIQLAQSAIPARTYVDEKELASYRFYHPYMFQRKLTEDVINKFDVGFDKNTNSITFPVYNKDNKCLFVVRRRVDRKQFHIPAGTRKCIFGINHVQKCSELVVCESVFNALTAEVYGYHAVALFGTGCKENYEELQQLPCRKLILMLDGDAAGRRGAEKIKAAVKGKIIVDIIMPTGKDVNDLSKKEFDELIKKGIV